MFLVKRKLYIIKYKRKLIKIFLEKRKKI